MVTIATFEKPEEAYMIRSVLEGSGIPAFVEGDLTVNVAWMYSNAIGGVKVQVRPEDAENAAKVLIEAKHPAQPVREGDDRACPRCGSQKVEYQRWSPRAFFLSLLLLGVPLPFFKGKFHCLACGHDWRKEQ